MTIPQEQERKSVEQLADEAFRSVPWQFVSNMSFESCYKNGFKNGHELGVRAAIEKLRAHTVYHPTHEKDVVRVESFGHIADYLERELLGGAE